MIESKGMTTYRGLRNNAKLWKALCIRLVNRDLTKEEYLNWLQLCAIRVPTDAEVDEQIDKANRLLDASVEE